MIDFHNHLMPGVDDGAASDEEARDALAAFAAQGFTAVVATPHHRASTADTPASLETRLARLDEAWARLTALRDAEFPDLRLERGVEVALDVLRPVLDDPRLRLAGTKAVLVEFASMTVPPNSTTVLFDLAMAGLRPILAHPERYPGLDAEAAQAAEWRRVGAALQVNAGSLLGKYGEGPKRLSWALVRNGWADYIASDFHARGTLHTAAAVAALEAAGGAEQARLLTVVNPGRLLEGKGPLPVPPLARPASRWRRIFRR